MNISDSLKYVLKNKSSNILSEFWSNDLKAIISSFGQDIIQMYKSGASSLYDIRKSSFSFKEVGESISDAFLILKLFPSRIRDGFLYFKDAFLEELEKKENSKEKTKFSLKILGALTSFSLGVVYGVKKGNTEFKLKGVKRRNAFTKFIVAELIFKISQHFINKILIEVESELSDTEDKKSIRYFRDLISTRPESDISSESMEEDRAIEIVEDLKRYIMTGKRKTLLSST